MSFLAPAPGTGVCCRRSSAAGLYPPNVLFLVAPEEEAHWQRHRGNYLPRREHAVCPRHDRLQLLARLHRGAGGEPRGGKHGIQGGGSSQEPGSAPAAQAEVRRWLPSRAVPNHTHTAYGCEY